MGKGEELMLSGQAQRAEQLPGKHLLEASFPGCLQRFRANKSRLHSAQQKKLEFSPKAGTK